MSQGDTSWRKDQDSGKQHSTGQEAQTYRLSGLLQSLQTPLSTQMLTGGQLVGAEALFPTAFKRWQQLG